MTMDDHGYDQAACRRAAELLREEARRQEDHPTPYWREQFDAFTWAAEWLEAQR